MILADPLGSVRLVVNASSGAVAQRLDYDEFGRVTLDTTPGFQPFGFAGGVYDADTGLTRFGARDYDAESGRWTGKDPVGFAGADANVFTYVLADPQSLLDWTGVSWQSAATSAAIGFVTGAVGVAAVSAAAASGTVVGGAIALAAVGYGAYQTTIALQELLLGYDPYTGAPLSPEQRADIAAGIGGALAGGGVGALGKEVPIGRGCRVAPLGNRTGDPAGELPHYHRATPDPANPGNSVPGQGIGRHRPWETKSTDTSFWDRF